MKTFPNAIVPLAKSETEKTSTHVDLCRFALHQNQQQGFDLPTIRARTRVLEALDKCEKLDSVELEDADHETLRVAVSQARWPYLHPCIIEFCKLLGL